MKAEYNARLNRDFWIMVFDGDMLSYRDIEAMDIAEYAECRAAKAMYIDLIRKEQEAARRKAGAE